MANVEKACDKCNKIFSIQVKRFNESVKKSSKIFCSKACRYSFFKTSVKIEVICQYCNNVTYKFSKNIKKNIFCNQECFINWKRKYLYSAIPKHKEKISIQCIDCNSIFEIYNRTKKNRKYNNRCRSCAAKHMHIEHLDVFSAAKLKISASVKAEMASLTPEQKYQRLKNFIEAGVKSNPGHSSKLELSLKHILEPLGFIHNKVFGISIGGTYPDYVCEHKKLLIEIHGDYWHCNPSKYSEEYFHQTKKQTALQIWQKDEQRLMSWSQNGYKTLVLWENDIKNNIDNVIEKVNSWVFEAPLYG